MMISAQFGGTNDYVVAYLRVLNSHVVRRLGLFPISIEPEEELSNKLVLDVPCGPGGWVLDVATRYPHIQVVGLDPDPRMLEAAHLFSYSLGSNGQELSNAHFVLTNIHHPLFPQAVSLPFPLKGHVDYIQVRGLSMVFKQNEWIPKLQELKDLLRIGGLLVLIETRVLETSSPALEDWVQLMDRLRELSIVPPKTLEVSLLESLQANGYKTIENQFVNVDFSLGTSDHGDIVQEVLGAIRLQEFPLVTARLTTPEYLQDLYNRVAGEVEEKGFRGKFAYVLIWGRS